MLHISMKLNGIHKSVVYGIIETYKSDWSSVGANRSEVSRALSREYFSSHHVIVVISVHVICLTCRALSQLLQAKTL